MAVSSVARQALVATSVVSVAVVQLVVMGVELKVAAVGEAQVETLGGPPVASEMVAARVEEPPEVQGRTAAVLVTAALRVLAAE